MNFLGKSSRAYIRTALSTYANRSDEWKPNYRGNLAPSPALFRQWQQNPSTEAGTAQGQGKPYLAMRTVRTGQKKTRIETEMARDRT